MCVPQASHLSVHRIPLVIVAALGKEDDKRPGAQSRRDFVFHKAIECSFELILGLGCKCKRIYRCIKVLGI